MSDEVADEYHRTVAPDFYLVADQMMREHFQRHPLPTLEQLEAARRARWQRHLGGFDNSNLAAAGVSIDDLIAVKASKRARASGGQMLPKGEARIAQRQRAYLAIRAADLAGQSWTQAIESAQAASLFQQGARDLEIDRKTLDRWLRALHEWGLISIAPPEPKGRGRPRKQE